MHPPSSRDPVPGHIARQGAAHDQLTQAAVRIARTLPSAHPVVGVLRGWDRAERGRARTLRNRLALMGLPALDVSPLPETGQRHRALDHPERPHVDLLLHEGGTRAHQALRIAALWRLPLLTPHRCPGDSADLMPLHARRRPVIAVLAPSGEKDIAVSRVTLTPLRPEAACVTVTPGEGAFHISPDRPLEIGLTKEGALDLRYPSRPDQRAHRLTFEPGGVFRVDIDGTPAHDFRTRFALESLPGRLHLLCP